MIRELIGGIEVFLTIVREGSLRAAARALGVSAPTISHQLKALEKKLGVDLMVRTTRSIELTQAGRSLLVGTGPAFDQIADAIETTRVVGKSATGTLRLTMPISAYRMLAAPILPEFAERYPDVRLDFSINEGLVDIVKDGFHAGFRLGDRVTSGMVAVRLTEALDPCYFASQTYLEAQGRPTHPRDLFNHSCVRYRYLTTNRIQDWQFVEDGQTKAVEAPTTIIFDAMEGVRQAVRDGLGIGWSLRTMIEDDLRSGELETVLEPYVVQVPPYYLFYPEQNRRFAPLRGFIELLKVRRDRSKTHVE